VKLDICIPLFWATVGTVRPFGICFWLFGSPSIITVLAMASAFAQPKKDGGPNVKFYESPETAQLFEGIKSWLVKNCKKVRKFILNAMF
jgi:SWIRM-associated domain at the N-terminal